MRLIGKWFCPYCGEISDSNKMCCDEMHMVEITEANLEESMEFLGDINA